MIPTLLRIGWLNLKRDYVALALTLVLPIAFFSIFAIIFDRSSAGGDSGSARPLRVILVDEDDSDVSRRFVEAIGSQQALEMHTTRPGSKDGADEGHTPPPYTRDEAHKLVRQGQFSAAVIIPTQWGASFGNFGDEQKRVKIIFDSANPMAEPTLHGLLQASAMQAAPDTLMKQGFALLDQLPGAELEPRQRAAIEAIAPFLRGDQPWSQLETEQNGVDGGSDNASPAAPPSRGIRSLVAVESTPARSSQEGSQGKKRKRSMIAYYAAGFAVMFLLFSMAGASGALLEEEESGTLERLLSSQVGMWSLLLGNWLFFALLGLLQVITMFVWGAVVFDLELWTTNRLVGFLVMSIVTAAAAAGFGVLLATLCKSRTQLNGASTIVILIMSALGGSMVPRFIMPKFMETTSKFTFNGWALDGYLKIFWYDDPDAGLVSSLANLLPQLAVLTGLTLVFLFAARQLARRWETV